MRPVSVYVGIGSNIQPERHVCRAVALLDDAFGELRLSQVYRCAPVGFVGADFLNLVAGFYTTEPLAGLHQHLRDIEAAIGRDRRRGTGARAIDIDLLLYGDRIQPEAEPCLPRPDILDYGFVLRPLAELAPSARHPVAGQTYAELWAGFAGPGSQLTAVDLGLAGYGERRA